MASPLDKLQSQFSLNSPTELQSLSSKAGRTAAPTQPMESAVIGGNPDQAKMAGSSANLQKSTQLSTESKQELPTYLRQLTGTRSLTETEQERMGRAQNMGQLNSLEGRVESMAQAAAAATPTGTATLSVNDPALVSKINDPVTRATAHDLLAKVAAGTATGVDYAALAPLLGYDAPTDAKSLTDISNDIKAVYLSDPAKSIGKAAASGTPDELFVGSLNPQELGFENFSELAALLKMPAGTDFTTFTIRQLTDQVAKIQAEEYSRTSSLMRLLSDPNVGAAEKEAARAQLSQLGATGILSAEADVSNLAEQADNINSVKIGDETFTISELLSDKHITGIVAGAIEDPAKLAALKETQPGLADWIETNKTGLEKIVGKIDPAIKVLGDTVTANNKLATPDGATKVSDNAMTILFGAGWKTTLNTLTPPPIYAALSDTTIPIAARQSLTNLINTLANHPEDLTYLKGLNQKDLSDKGLLSAEGITKYANYLNSSQVLAGFDPATTAPESVLSTVFGTDNMGDLSQIVAQVKLLNDTNLGDDLSGGLLDILDKNHDGVIDDIGTIVETAQSFFSGKSVKDLLKGADGTPDVADGQGLLKAIRTSISTAQQDPLYINYVANKGVLADGKIDDADVGRLKDAPLPDLEAMIAKGVPGASKLQSIIDSKAGSEVSRLLTEKQIFPTELNATFENSYVGQNTLKETALKIKGIIDTAEFDALSPAVKAQMYAAFDKAVNRSYEEYTKFTRTNISRQLDVEVSQPRSQIINEINALQKQYFQRLKAGQSAKQLQFLQDMRLAASKRLTQLDADTPTITNRLMQEEMARHPAKGITDLQGYRKT